MQSGNCIKGRKMTDNMNSLVLSYFRALEIVADEFTFNYDKGGAPYCFHCIEVMKNVGHLGTDYQIVALLHDLLEDVPSWNVDRLKEEGFSDTIIEAIVTLTHVDGESYDRYVERIGQNKIAIEVKLADLKHNMDLSRLKVVRSEDLKRNEKYRKAMEYLLEKKQELSKEEK